MAMLSFGVIFRSMFRLPFVSSGPLILGALMLAVPLVQAELPSSTPVTASPSAVPATPAEGGHQFIPPKVRERLPVAYPLLAHLNRTQGVVRAVLSIDEAGNVTKAIVTKSSGSVMLDAVVNNYNLLHWKFDPATLDGKPVPSTKEQEFEFRLDPAEEKAIALKRLALPVGIPDAPYPKEAIPLKLRGSVTIGVRWSNRGLVDLIYYKQTSGFPILDHTALRWAYENWHIDPATLNDKNKDDEFSKTLSFEPPRG